MHPLKKDEFKLLNRMKFEAKNVVEHLNKVAEDHRKINAAEMERRLEELRKYSRELARVQKAIDLEVQKQR
jgi:hypothetical protein